MVILIMKKCCKSIVSIIKTTIFVIVLATAVFFLFACSEYQETDDGLNDINAEKYELHYLSGELGNTYCNIANGGAVCEYQGNIYLVKNDTELYVFPVEKPDEIRLLTNDADGIQYINIVGGNVFYVAGYVKEGSCIKRFDLRLHNTSIVYECDPGTTIYQMVIRENWLYFLLGQNLYSKEQEYDKYGYFRLNLETNRAEILASWSTVDSQYRKQAGDDFDNIFADCSEFVICSNRLFFIAKYFDQRNGIYPLFSVDLSTGDMQFHVCLDIEETMIISKVYTYGEQLLLEGSKFVIWDDEPRAYLYKVDIGAQAIADNSYKCTVIDSSHPLKLDDSGLETSAIFYQLYNDKIIYCQVDSYYTQNISIGEIDITSGRKKVLFNKIYPKKWNKNGISTYNTFIAGDYLFWDEQPSAAYNLLTGEYIDCFPNEDGNNKPELSDFLDMTSKEIAQDVFGNANQIYYWCLGMETISQLDEDNFVEDEAYRRYFKVISNEFKTYADLKEYLLKYFSEDVVQQMLLLNGTKNVNGELYQLMPEYGGPDMTYSVEYTIVDYSESKIVFCECSKYLKDPWADIPETLITDSDLNIINRYYILEKCGQDWLFTGWDMSEKPAA